jgi:hypothetical protein
MKITSAKKSVPKIENIGEARSKISVEISARFLEASECFSLTCVRNALWSMSLVFRCVLRVSATAFSTQMISWIADDSRDGSWSGNLNPACWNVALRAPAEAMTGAIHFVPWSKPTRVGQFWFFHVPSFPQAGSDCYPCGFQTDPLLSSFISSSEA